MEPQFNRKPCLILEATELLYVFVNQLSPRMLTADGPYCIPPAEVSAFMEEVCGSLSPEEPTLHYYFQKYQLLEQSGATCLARLMVFSFVNLNESDPGLSFQALCDAWDRLRQGGYYFTSCSEYGLSMYAPRDSSTVPFAHGLWKLPLPLPCKEQLMEVFSDFPRHTKRLAALMKPVMERLGSALAPWVDRAEPLIRQWEATLQDQDLAQFLQTHMLIQTDYPLDSATASLLFFMPNLTPGLVDEKRRLTRFCIGVNIQPQKGIAMSKLEEWEYTAMRLLGSPARMEMMNAMRQRPMTSRELSQELGLHLGTVTRDIRNMHNARLLNMKLGGSRPHYSVNFDTIRALAQRLLDMCRAPNTTESEEAPVKHTAPQ